MRIGRLHHFRSVFNSMRYIHPSAREARSHIAQAIDRTSNIQKNPGRETFQHLAVIGEVASGKTTLTKLLSKLLELRRVELDKLIYLARYENKNSTPILRDFIVNELNGKTWVSECHYSHARKMIRDLVLARADTIVWLDYSLSLILYRLLRRSFNRIIFNSERKNYWKEGNRSKLSLKRELGMFLNVLRRYLTREGKKLFQLLFNDPRYAHLNIVRLSSPRALYTWLFKIARAKQKSLFPITRERPSSSFTQTLTVFTREMPRIRLVPSKQFVDDQASAQQDVM